MVARFERFLAIVAPDRTERVRTCETVLLSRTFPALVVRDFFQSDQPLVCFAASVGLVLTRFQTDDAAVEIEQKLESTALATQNTSMNPIRPQGYGTKPHAYHASKFANRFKRGRQLRS